MIKSARSNRGFTLIELMMTVALLGIFFGIVYGFLNYNFKFLNRRNDEHDAYLQARIAMFRVANLLQQYQELRVSGNVVQYNNIGNQWSDLINFDRNSQNPGDHSIYYFYWDDNAGQIRKTSGDDIIAGGITKFDFVPADTSLIKVTISAVSPDEPDDPGLTLSTYVRESRQYN